MCVCVCLLGLHICSNQEMNEIVYVSTYESNFNLKNVHDQVQCLLPWLWFKKGTYLSSDDIHM